MRYAPHIVRAGGGSFEGTIQAVFPIHKVAGTPEYPIFVKVSLAGVPYGHIVHRARFMGSLTDDELGFASVRIYDEMISQFRNQTSPARPLYPPLDNTNRATNSVQGWLELKLAGRHVTVQKQGGRWIAL